MKRGTAVLIFLLLVGLAGFVSAQNATTCIDNDGEDYYFSSYIKEELTDWGATLDTCPNSTSVEERVCIGGKGANKYLTCPNGCENGACKYICSDSDGGVNYFIKGKIIEVVGSSNNTATDNCISEKILSEYYCSVPGVNNANSLTYTCQVACENGVCINQTSSVGNTFCIDSDGGRNFYIKGYVSTNYNEQDPNDYVYDSCMIPDPLTKGQEIGNFSCSGEHCQVQDFYCDGDVGGYGSFLSCPNGCKDGACISPPNSTMISPTNETGPIEVPEISENEPAGESANYFCNGCELDDKCYPFGYRKSGKYCFDSGQFVNQLKAGNFCENSFECDSNLCVDDECISKGFFQKIIEWFRKLFGKE